jgi:hypothetical protein
MHRTADRPMAAGRISLTHGLVLGFAATFLGSLYLAYATNLLTGTLTLLTAIGYVAIYTPLKRVTTLNTFIGAFPGALPPLIGWTAARGLIEWPGVALFAILFVWQFPHFMAIGWMYREDYTRGGIRLTPNLPNTHYAALSTVVQALFYAAIMIPVSLWPATLHVTGTPLPRRRDDLGLTLLGPPSLLRVVRNPDPKPPPVAREPSAPRYPHFLAASDARRQRTPLLQMQLRTRHKPAYSAFRHRNNHRNQRRRFALPRLVYYHPPVYVAGTRLAFLPALDAVLNATRHFLAIAGYRYIRRRQVIAHRNTMFGAFIERLPRRLRANHVLHGDMLSQGLPDGALHHLGYRDAAHLAVVCCQ